MSTGNPYAPPEAHVTDIEGEYVDDGSTQPLQLSTYKGRIGRLRYMAWTFASYVVMMAIIALGARLDSAVAAPGLVEGIFTLLSYLFFIPYAFWTIQRSHDMGWNGWTWLWTLVPFVIFVWFINSGTRGRNMYGAPPPPNTLGVHLLSWSIPLILIIATIVVLIVFGAQLYQMLMEWIQAQSQAAKAR